MITTIHFHLTTRTLATAHELVFGDAIHLRVKVTQDMHLGDMHGTSHLSFYYCVKNGPIPVMTVVSPPESVIPTSNLARAVFMLLFLFAKDR